MLRKENVTIKGADDPLLFLERRRYLDVPHVAVTELETARVVVVGVVGEAGGRSGLTARADGDRHTP